jgi:hypothetical protein
LIVIEVSNYHFQSDLVLLILLTFEHSVSPERLRGAKPNPVILCLL